MDVSSRLTSYSSPSVLACSGKEASNDWGTGSASPVKGTAATLACSSMSSDGASGVELAADIKYALIRLDSRAAICVTTCYTGSAFPQADEATLEYDRSF